MSGLSTNVKKQIIGTLTSRGMRTDDYWEYAVLSSWFSEWQNPPVEAKQCTSPHDSLSSWMSGSSVDVEPLRMDVTPSPLTMSENDRENIYIPETYWKIMVTWFGLDEKHQLRRRPVQGRYMPLVHYKWEGDRNILCDKEQDFLPIWVAKLEDLVQGKRQELFRTFAWESFEHITKQVRRVLGVKRRSKVRIWFNVQEDGQHLALEPVIDMQQQLICKVTEVVPEVVDVLHRRQNQSRNERGPLGQDWFGDRILGIAIGVEEIGMNVAGTHSFKDEFLPVDEETIESIVTISSIRNEWDDVLTTCVEEYSENMNEKTKAVKENLLSAAKQIVGEKLDEIIEIRTDFEKRFRDVESKEDAVKVREKEVAVKEEELATRLARYKSGIEDFQRQKQKFTEDVKRIEEQNKITQSRVTLNIGGIMYATSIATLTKAEGSLFATMFSGSEALSRDADGSYFIDRDGINFRYILNYLRDGTGAVDALPADPKIVKELLIEARYYKLPEMERLLQRKLCN